MPKLEDIEIIGTIGDCNPFDHGGGIVFRREGRDEIVWFEPLEDDDDGQRMETPGVRTQDLITDEMGDVIPGVEMYGPTEIPEDVMLYHSWAKWDEVRQYVGSGNTELEYTFKSKSQDPMDRALVLQDLASHWEWHEAIGDALYMTREEAEQSWGHIVDAAAKKR